MNSIKSTSLFLFFILVCQTIFGQLTFGVTYTGGMNKLKGEQLSYGLYEEYGNQEVVDGTLFYKASSSINMLSLDAKYRVNLKHGLKASLSYYQDNWVHNGLYYDKDFRNEAVVIFPVKDYSNGIADEDGDDGELLFEESDTTASQYLPRFESLRTHYVSLSLGNTFYIRERLGFSLTCTLLFKTAEYSTYHLYDNEHLSTTSPEINYKSNIMPFINMDLEANVFWYIVKNKIALNAGVKIHNLAFLTEIEDEPVFDFPGLEYRSPLLFTGGISWDIFAIKTKKI